MQVAGVAEGGEGGGDGFIGGVFHFLEAEDVRLQLGGVAGEGGKAPGGVEIRGIDIGVELRPDVGGGEDVPGGYCEWQVLLQDSWRRGWRCAFVRERPGVLWCVRLSTRFWVVPPAAAGVGRFIRGLWTRPRFGLAQPGDEGLIPSRLCLAGCGQLFAALHEHQWRSRPGCQEPVFEPL